MEFPRLPVVEFVKGLARTPSALRDICIVSIQHLLRTTGSMFRAFIELGCHPDNIHVLGKLYSANSEVVGGLKAMGVQVYPCSERFDWGDYDRRLASDTKLMWASVERCLHGSGVKRLIVLDDGGCAITGTPADLADCCAVVGVEQTMSGLQKAFDRKAEMPILEVASSAAKKFIEPPIIANAIFARVDGLAANPSGLVAGVVGAGSIGQAVASALARNGWRVVAYDRDPSARIDRLDVDMCLSLEELWEDSDVVWGCTGEDILRSSGFWKARVGVRTLISCSSSDREFREALRLLNSRPEMTPISRLASVAVQTGDGLLRILNGGFPVNFDRSPESAPDWDIQMTRGLLLAGVLQATDLRDRGTGSLSPVMQSKIVNEWLRVMPERRSLYNTGLLEFFNDLDWIEENSGTRLVRR
jgi:hypothetical protein